MNHVFREWILLICSRIFIRLHGGHGVLMPPFFNEYP